MDVFTSFKQFYFIFAIEVKIAGKSLRIDFKTENETAEFFFLWRNHFFSFFSHNSCSSFCGKLFFQFHFFYQSWWDKKWNWNKNSTKWTTAVVRKKEKKFYRFIFCFTINSQWFSGNLYFNSTYKIVLFKGSKNFHITALFKLKMVFQKRM